MDINRIVTSQGVWFRNNLYWSDVLKALVGQRVQLVLDSSGEDRALVIQGERVVDVKLIKRGNRGMVDPPPAATNDLLAELLRKTRIPD